MAQPVSNQLRTSGSYANKPLDERYSVNRYYASDDDAENSIKSIQNMSGAYIGLHVYVTDLEKNGTDKRGEYVITKLTSDNDVDMSGVKTLQEYVGEQDPQVYEWAKQPTKPSYNASEVGAVPDTRKVNNKSLSSDIQLTPSDIGAHPTIDSSHKLSADNIADGSDNKVVTQDEKNTWNGKQDALTQEQLTNITNGGSAIQGIKKGNTALTPDSNKVVTIPSDIEGANASSLPAGSTPTATIDTNNILQLGIPSGNDGHNPCLGRYDELPAIANLPEAPRAGDYIYVDDKTDPTNVVTTLYKYDATSQTGFDQGIVVDVNNLTFNSGEELINTNIDSTQLSNPLPNALAKADDVMPLAIKLEGITAEIIRVSPVDGTVLTEHYVGENGSTAGTSTNYDCAAFDVENYSFVKFRGVEMATSTNSRGFAFYDENDNYIAGSYKNYDVTGTFQEKTYLEEIPEGAKYFRTNIRAYDKLDSFFCFKLKGKNVLDIIPKIADNLTTDDSTKALSAKQGMLLRNELYLKSDIEDEQLILTTSNYLSGFYPDKDNYVWKKSSYTTQTGGWLVEIENQNTIMIEGNNRDSTFITFLKSIPDKSSLANGDPLDVCEGQLNRRNIVGKEIIPIPEDCRCIFVINTTVINVNQAPTSMSIYSDKPLKDIVSEQQEEINENKSGIEAIFNPYTEIDLLQVGTRIDTWYIGTSNENLNMWHYYGNSNIGCIYINVVPGQVYRVEKDSSLYTAFTFLKTIPDFSEHADHVNFTPDYAEGISGNIFVNRNNSPFVEIAAPSDAQYMCFVRQTTASGTTNGILPTRVALKSNVQRLNNIENRIMALEDSEDSRPQDLFKIQANSIKAATTQETIGTGLTTVSYPNNPNRGTQITSMQIKNFIDKVDSMIFTWRPKHNIPAKKAHNNIYTYPKDTNIPTGVPYSSNMVDNKHVGLDTSVYTFRTAIDNPYSVMYTECIYGSGTWPLKSAWGRKYECSNGFAYYGTVCCSFSSSVLGSPIKWGNTVHDDYARDYGEFIPLAPKGVINWNAMQVGDVFDDDKHSYVVYDLARDSNGEVTAVTYAESSNKVGSYGGCRRVSYSSPSEFKFRDHESKGIYSSHYRYAKLCFNDKVRDKDTADYWNTLHTYNNAISTIYGDEPCLAQGELVVLNYNLYDTQEYTWTEIEVYKFQPTYYRLLTSQPNNWATDYGEYYVKENGEYRKLSTEDEPLDTMPDFSPNTYYERLSNPIEDWENIKTEQLSNMDTILNTFYSENNITPDPYNQDIDQHGHAFVLGYGLDPGLYKACMSDGTHRSGYVNWEILPNDFTITPKGKGVYIIHNNTGKLMKYVLVGKQISGDYRGFETSYGGRPISTYENNANELTLYVSEMTNIDKPKIKFVLQGEYGLSTTNPINLPDVEYEDD